MRRKELRRLITLFSNETRTITPLPNMAQTGIWHHIVFSASQSTFIEIAARLSDRGANARRPQPQLFRAPGYGAGWLQ
jgi:hypothetical protein